MRFGVNEVIRCMQKNFKLSCILISGNTSVENITNCIYSLATTKNLPVLVVNDLENILCNYIGFKTLVAVFMLENVHNCFQDLHNTIVDIFKKNCISNMNIDNIITQSSTTIKKKNVMQEETNNKKVTHLERKSTETRIFVPKKEAITKSLFGDFITINNEKTPQHAVLGTNLFGNKNIKYISLKIKKIQGNKRRRK